MVEPAEMPPPKWIVCTALPAELKPIRKRMWQCGVRLCANAAWPGSLRGTWHGVDVVLGTLGFRAVRQAALRAYLAQQQASPVRGVVLLGLAGALNASWRTGDLAVATAVFDARTNTATRDHTTTTWHAAEDTVQLAHTAATQADLALHPARLLTHANIISEPATKASLAADTGCDLVEMEAAALVADVVPRGLDWLCVRAVLDTAHERLPALDRLAEARRLRLMRELAILACTQPRSLVALPRLGWRSAACGRKLAAFAEAFVAAQASQPTSTHHHAKAP